MKSALERRGGYTSYYAPEYSPSPYINRFLQPDSIIPDQTNPQNLNRFAYVINNPIRFNDPTGHTCSDPDDPTPTCDGGGGPPPNTPSPFPSAPVIIRNPDSLEDGLHEDDPTPTRSGLVPSIVRDLPQPDSLQPDHGIPWSNDPVVITNPDLLDGGLIMDPGCYCGVPVDEQPEGSTIVRIAGLLLFVQMGLLDLVIGGGIILSANAGPLGWAAEVILVPLEITTLGFTIFAAQLAATGTTDHDPFPIWHSFFPDFLPNKP